MTRTEIVRLYCLAVWQRFRIQQLVKQRNLCMEAIAGVEKIFPEPSGVQCVDGKKLTAVLEVQWASIAEAVEKAKSAALSANILLAGRKSRIQELERELLDIAAQRDALAAAMPDLTPVITWLANGCDATAAMHELVLLQNTIDRAKGGA